MYTIEEYDKEKSKVLKYVLYKKRSKKEVQNKFYNYRFKIDMSQIH